MNLDTFVETVVITLKSYVFFSGGDYSHGAGTMIDSEGKKFVFRIADIGFSLAVDALIEIREADGVEIDKSTADLNRGLLGQILFRNAAVPFWDARQLLGLPYADDDNVLVFVFGTDGAWAFLIETVVGVVVAVDFQTCDIPILLHRRDRQPFTSIDIWHNEPLVCFEPALVERFMVQV